MEKSYTGDALQARKERLLSDWRSDEEQLEEAVEIARQFHQKQLDKIHRLLAEETEATLSEPAGVARRNWHPNDLDGADPLFQPEAAGYMVIPFNPDYFDDAIVPIGPQFMTAYWSWNNTPFSQHFSDPFRHHLDVKSLAAMSGK